MAARPTQSSGRLVVAGGGLMPPRLMLVPAGVSLPPGVHPVGLARVTSSSAGLGLEDVGFGTTPAAAGGGLRFSCAALSGHHVLSSAGLGLVDVGFGTNLHVLSSNGALSGHHVLSSAGVHPVGLARVASSSAGLGLEDVGFGTTPAAAGGGLRFSCAALSGHHVLSSAGLGLEDVGFGTNLHVLSSNGALSGHHVLSSAGLGLEDVGFGTNLHVLSSNGVGLGFASASRTSLLVAAATRGSEAEGGDGNDSAADAKRARYEEMKHTVLLAWDHTEEGTVYQPISVFGDWYQPLGFFADEDVEAFKERADQGTLLMRILLERGFHYSNNDMWVLAYAGLCLRRVSAQAGHGMVWDGAVVEASLAVQLVFMRLLAGVPGPAPQDPKVAKIAYTQQRLEDFVSLIKSLQSVVDPE